MTDTPWLDYRAPRNSLAGKRILITGAGSGIGATLAQTCAAQGAEVLLLGRNQARLEQVYDAILSSGGPKPGICLFDLEAREDEAYDDLAVQVEEACGSIDALVHNAGLLGQLTPIANYRSATWMSVIQVNLNAAFLLTRSLLPLLRESAAGRILFTTSNAGRRGKAFWGAHSASKFALEGLTAVLADELDGTSNITVNAINPGRVRTKMRASAYPAENPNTLPGPEAIMPTYLFFLGEEGGKYNGLSVNAQ